MQAIVLAGGGLPVDFAGIAPVESKAFLPILEKPMVEYVTQTLYHGPFSQIVLVGDERAVTPSIRSQVDKIVPPGKNIVGSLSNGLAGMQDEKQVFVCAGDLPLLSVAVVEQFLRQSRESAGELTYSIVRREDSEKAFPGFPHTYVKLKEGSFCGGGLFLLPPVVLDNFRHLMTQMTEMRKAPWKMAGLLGVDIILKLIFKSLSIADLEKKAGSLLGVTASAVVSPPEAAFNVDHLSQYKSAVKILQEKQNLART